MSVPHELEVLRVLTQKYGHYLGKYFGFTLKEVAQRTGMSYTLLSKVLAGKRPMPERHLDRLTAAIRDMKIEERTKDFKESPDQLWWRSHWAQMKAARIILTIFGFGCIVFTMRTQTASFYLPSQDNFPQYITFLVGKTASFLFSLKAVVVSTTIAACVFLAKVTQKLRNHHDPAQEFFEAGFCF